MRTTFLILSLAVVCQINGSGQAKTNVSAGEVNGAWTAAQSPYHILGDITIPSGDSLVIEPGVQVIFKGHYKLDVKGTLLALGTPSDSIVFTRLDTAGLYQKDDTAGGWNGIRFDNRFFNMENRDVSMLKYCQLSHAKAVTTDYWDGGGIYIYNFSKLHIEDCSITGCIAARFGGGLYYDGIENPVLKNNYIAWNSADSMGGGIYLGGDASTYIYGNKIVYNHASYSGGGMHCEWSSAKIINNVIADNHATIGGGITISSGGRDEVFGNIIVNNKADYQGGGIMSRWGSSKDILNNTIAFNESQQGPGIHFSNDYISTFGNNILWGNYGFTHPGQMYIESNTAAPKIISCIIEDGFAGVYIKPGVTFYGSFENNMDLDPQFVTESDTSGTSFDWTQADFQILPGSPAINKGVNGFAQAYLGGKDYFGAVRVLHGNIDIGASEAHIQAISVSGTQPDNSYWMADTVYVGGDVFIPDEYTLTIAAGTRVVFEGYHELTNQGTVIARGTTSNPIVFTSLNTLGFHDRTNLDGAWKGIGMDNSWNGANAAMSDNDTSVFEHCIVEYAKNFNSGWDNLFGGGIQIRGFSNLVIRDCIIRNNMAFNGGGIAMDNYSGPLIIGNKIYNNVATNQGGGMYINQNCFPVLTGNLISNNVSDGSGTFYPSSGGVFLQMSDVVFQNNIVCNNESGTDGGGMLIRGGASQFSNNVIAFNQSLNSGAGLSIGPNETTFYNTIIWGNSSVNSTIDQVFGWGDLDFSYCNVQDGMSDVGFGDGSTKVANLEAISGHEPGFVDPSGGSGTAYDGTLADWSITDFSPLINAGLADLPDFDLLPTDFAGNPRVNDGQVDIGAYENTAHPLGFITQPDNIIACEGDSVSFSVKVSGPATYQWLKGEDEITGETGSVLSIGTVYAADEDIYSCIASNGYGLVSSNRVSMTVRTAPEVLYQTGSHWLIENDATQVEVIPSGSVPMIFQWYKDFSEIQGADKMRLRFPDVQSSDEGSYYCTIENACGLTSTDTMQLYLAPQICMVTIDTVTGKNLVIWEKNTIAPLASYYVYRESVVRGQYELLAEVPADELSVYTDTAANPVEQPYIYKITALNIEGEESSLELCKPHKTIHLLTSFNTESSTAQLDWDEYYGFDYGTYFIYRSDTQSGFSKVKDISSSFRTWLDTEALPNTVYYYRVSVARGEECNPTGTGAKAGTGPYSHSLSNLDDNKLKTTDIYDVSGHGRLMVYPNPSSGDVMLRLPGSMNVKYRLYIRDLSGKVLRLIEDISGDGYLIERGDLSAGYYEVELAGDGRIFRTKMILN